MKKFSIKSAVAAVALAASGMAFGQVAVTDAFLEVVDASGNTFIADLGAASALAANSTINVTSFAAWATFAGASTLSADSYFVIGGTGTRAGISSVSGAPGATPTASQLNTLFGSTGGSGTQGTSLIISALGGAGSATTSIDVTSAQTGSFASVGGGNSYGGLYPSTVVSGIFGTALNLYQVNTGSLLGTINVGTAVATPEPGSYALMLAGLLAVGTIARRRSQG